MNFSPLGAYANVARLTELPSSPAKPTAAAAAPQQAFKETVAEVARQAVQTVEAGENAARAGLTGTMDAHQVVAAMSQAELTIQATIAIRDKMVQAYQEIMRMPI